MCNEFYHILESHLYLTSIVYELTVFFHCVIHTTGFRCTVYSVFFFSFPFFFFASVHFWKKKLKLIMILLKATENLCPDTLLAYLRYKWREIWNILLSIYHLVYLPQSIYYTESHSILVGFCDQIGLLVLQPMGLLFPFNVTFRMKIKVFIAVHTALCDDTAWLLRDVRPLFLRD